MRSNRPKQYCHALRTLKQVEVFIWNKLNLTFYENKALFNENSNFKTVASKPDPVF